MSHPLVPIAFARWRRMDWQDVLNEMAVLFHLAAKIEDVKKIAQADDV